MARAYYTQDRERLRQFGRVMLTGLTETPEDNPAILLRNQLLRLQTGSTRPVADVTYRKAERALPAFIEREKISMLYEASAELFPLPEETATRKGKAR